MKINLSYSQKEKCFNYDFYYIPENYYWKIIEKNIDYDIAVKFCKNFKGVKEWPSYEIMCSLFHFWKIIEKNKN